MAYGDATFMRDDPTILQRRFSAFIQPYPAKVLARKAGCTEHTAESWRAGRSWPSARHWLYLVSTFGRDLTECVFHPDAAAARLTEEVAELEAKLAERRATLGVVASEARAFAHNGQKARAHHEDRASGLEESDGVRR